MERLVLFGNKIISGALSVILLLGSLVSCNRSTVEYTQNVNSNTRAEFITFTPDDFQSIINDDNFFISYEQLDAEFAQIINDEFIETLLDKYNANIDDIFISLISVVEDTNLESTIYDFERIIDPERKLDTGRIFSNLLIGAVIVLICISIPAIVPGISPTVAAILLTAPKVTLIGAATDVAISGVIGYVKSDGDLKTAFYDAVESGTEGFKYGAVFTPGYAAFTSIKAARTAKKITQTAMRGARSSQPRNVNFSENIGMSGGRRILNTVDDIALVGMPRNEFIKKYGQELYNDIFNYSKTQFDDIVLAMQGLPLTKNRGVVNGIKYQNSALSDALRARGDRISSFLKGHSITRETTFWQGIRGSSAQIEMRYNVKNLAGKSPEEIKDILINGGRTSSPDLMTSSTLRRNTHVENYAIFSKQVSANDIMILRELRGPVGTQAFYIDNLCHSYVRGIGYVLMPKGLTTKVIGADVESIIRDGVEYKVIRVIEEVIIGGYP